MYLLLPVHYLVYISEMFCTVNTTLLCWPLLYSVISIALLLGFYFKRSHRYWADRGVPFIKPSSLFFGSFGDVILHRRSQFEHDLTIYRQLADYKYGGYYAFDQPRLIFRDPELLKSVLAKDFSHFYDRNSDLFSEKIILSRNMFVLTGNKWKIMRAKLTPTFTSGKIKLMFDTVSEKTESMLAVLQRTLSELKTGGCRHVEMKDLMSRYTMEVISSCAFGLDANSLREPDTLLRKATLEHFSNDWKVTLVTALKILCPPNVTKYVKAKLLDDVVKRGDFYRKLVGDTVRFRRENGIKKNDFIGLLMAIQEDEEKRENVELVYFFGFIEMTIDVMTAQCFLFLVAGFETTATTLSFCLLELSKDIKVQENVRREIENVLRQTDGRITYESLRKMTYMDQVVLETLRLYPALTTLPRMCTMPYEIPGTNVTVQTGTIVEIPVVGIHYDPQYYPNPEQFNPEHFSEENINSRLPYTYLPFGEGPKMCIGVRFGMMQVKLALTMLIKHYEFKLSPKMKLPIEYIRGPIQVPNSQTGIWLICNKLD